MNVLTTHRLCTREVNIHLSAENQALDTSQIKKETKWAADLIVTQLD